VDQGTGQPKLPGNLNFGCEPPFPFCPGAMQGRESILWGKRVFHTSKNRTWCTRDCMGLLHMEFTVPWHTFSWMCSVCRSVR